MKKIDELRFKMLCLSLFILAFNSLDELAKKVRNEIRMEAIAPDTKPIKIVRVSQK